MKLVCLFALALLLPAAAIAQHQIFVVNPEASAVRMKLNTTHEVVNGTFHIATGAVDFDPSTTHIGGIIVVAAGSGKTGNDTRDRKMTNDILQAPQFVNVSFAPKSYTGAIADTGDSTIQVSGVFTLLGTPHDLTIPMQVHIGSSQVLVKADFVVPYVQWGLKNPSFLFWKAEDVVEISLNLTGHLSN